MLRIIGAMQRRGRIVLECELAAFGLLMLLGAMTSCCLPGDGPELIVALGVVGVLAAPTLAVWLEQP